MNTDDTPSAFNAKHYAPTGFQSPANGSEEAFLDLNELLIHRPSATFFMRMSGDALCDLAIADQDILVVDRSVTAGDRDIVVAEYQGEFKVRVLRTQPTYRLEAANVEIPAIEFSEEDAPVIFGVVTGLARNLRGHR